MHSKYIILLLLLAIPVIFIVWNHMYLFDTISSIFLRFKFRNILKEFPYDCVIAGGSVLSLLTIKRIYPESDIDLFVINKKEQERLYKLYPENKGVISLYSHSMDRFVQLILYKEYSTPQELIKDFDLNVISCGFYKNKLYYDNDWKASAYNKTIKIVNMPTTMKRLSKYQDRGYFVTQESISEYFKNVKFILSDLLKDPYYPSDTRELMRHLGVKFNIVCRLKKKI